MTHSEGMVPRRKRHESQSIGGFLKETLGILFIAFLLAMLLRTYVIEPRLIPSGSMLPTIELQDRVLVNKFIYHFTTPQRLDVIVFKPPESIEQNDDFIKRVIGLPGETIEIKNGKVLVNNKALVEPYIMEEPNYTYGPVVVPDNCLFVLGDNRRSSLDSHAWNGAWLNLDNVKGKAFFTYWPLNRLGSMK